MECKHTVAGNAALTCGNANVQRVAARLSPRVRARGTPLASEHARGAQTLRAASANGGLWMTLDDSPASAERTARVTMTDSVVLSCAVCGYPILRPVSSGSELCGPCLYLAVFRERFSRGTQILNGRGRLRARKDSA